MLLRPLNDWVLVALDAAPQENISAFGIVFTRPLLVRTGYVLRVGPGRRFVDGVYQPTEVKEGERVAFLAAVLDSKQGYTLQDILGKDRVLIRESDILFVITEGNPRLDK
jgi:co-chaperonin GroES (HSP10)